MFIHGQPAAMYRQTSIETAAPGQLITMMYRRAILCARIAAQAIEAKDPEKAHNNLVRAQAIIVELQQGLNREIGTIAEGLGALYEFFYSQLLEANLEKNAEKAGRTADMMESLLEAWEIVLAGKASAATAASATATPR